MSKVWKKVLGVIGVESADDQDEEKDYYEEEEQFDEEPEPVRTRSESRRAPKYEFDEPDFSRRRSKVIAMPETNGRMRMIIFRPVSFEETQGIIDNLKSRKPVIVNLDDIDTAVAQRILDFISGAVYSLGGDIRKAARNIFVVAPSNVDISTNLEDDVTDEEYGETASYM